jgi:hypothetical protein
MYRAPIRYWGLSLQGVAHMLNEWRIMRIDGEAPLRLSE